MCHYCLFPLWDVLNPRRLVHLNKMLGFKHRIVVCNSLNPYIDIQILICCPYTWSIEAVGRIWWSINSIHLPWSCTQFWLPLCFTKINIIKRVKVRQQSSTGLEIMKDIKKIIFPERCEGYFPNANLTKESTCNLRGLPKRVNMSGKQTDP